MNIPELFASLAALPIFHGIGLGMTIAILLALAYAAGRRSISILFLMAVLGVLGVVVTRFFPAYYSLIVWVTALFTGGILILVDQPSPSHAEETVPTSLRLIALISAPLLLTAVSGLLAFWPPLQIGSSFETTWVIFILLSLSLWQIARSRQPLMRTIGFIGGLAGLGLWQVLRLDAPVVLIVWSIVTLAAALVGPLVGQRPTALEFNHESG